MSELKLRVIAREEADAWTHGRDYAADRCEKLIAFRAEILDDGPRKLEALALLEMVREMRGNWIVPFLGSGTTAQVAQRLERRWIGIELNAEYLALQARRTAQGALALETET